jgi:hypothetical protein
MAVLPRTIFIVVFFLAITSAVFFFACQGGESPSNALTSEQQGKQPQVVVDVLPMDDPNNPYAASYDPIDHWVYANRVATSRGPSNDLYDPDQMTEDEYFMGGLVTEAGYLLPYREFVNLQQEAIADGTSMNKTKADATWLYAIGVLSDEYAQKAWDLAWDVKAAYYMPVPEWLAKNPPQSAMLLANGDVVTCGPLGWEENSAPADDVDDNSGCCGGGGIDDGHFKYSHEGKVLGFTNHPWFALYYDVEVEGLPPGLYNVRADGYLLCTSPDGDLIVYDFDGTKLDLSEEPPIRDMHHFEWLPLRRIRKLYEAQQRIACDL